MTAFAYKLARSWWGAILSLLLTATLLTTVVKAQKQIEYRVISPIQEGVQLSVVVDDKTFQLTQSTDSPLIHIGTAPVSDGYYYAKTKDDSIVEQEYMVRHNTFDDDDATPYQFYNRSQDRWNISPLPKAFDPLSAIHRIDSDLHVYGEIPTIHIIGNQTEVDQLHTNVFDDYKIVTKMVYVRGNELKTFDNVEFELAGRGSRFSAKLSYNIKIPKDGDSTLYGYRRFKLRSLMTDPSYIRESVSYAAIDATGLAATRFSFVRVFINNEVAGFFGLIENYKNPWYRNVFGDGNKDYSQGNSYQGMMSSDTSALYNHTSDLSYYGDNITAYADGQYKIKEDPSKGEPSYEPLMELTKFLSDAPTDSEDAVDQWEQHFDMESVLRAMALEVLLGFSDAYSTMVDNYYIYQDGVDSKRFIYIPSDLDLSIGNTIVKLSDMLTGDYHTFPGLAVRPLTSKFLLVPEFKERYETLLQDLTDKLINLDVMEPFIDDTVTMIREDVEWDTPLERLNKFNFSSLAGSGDGSGLTDGWPWPVDKPTLEDMFYYSWNTTFDTAVNGPTGFISLAGVKEFIANQSRATTEYFKTRQE